jgi:hypothetical protein
MRRVVDELDREALIAAVLAAARYPSSREGFRAWAGG